MAKGKQIPVRLDADVEEMLERFREQQPVTPPTAAVVNTALREFLTQHLKD
ncbi:hypothetical protein LCM28_09860 [Salipiger pacificus]|nr:hypothetical protein [Alloyangia pacifica]